MDLHKAMVLAAVMLAASGYTEEADEREADVTVIAERIPPSEMSFDDMEFVALAVDCGKRLFVDGQEAAAWPYLQMGARYGDVDSQFWAASMLGRGEHVPQNWTEAVGWLGVAADGHLKPDATKMLRETKESLCDGRDECGEQFDTVVAEYVRRFGRESGGMACRRAMGQRGVGVSSLRINRGSRRVDCVFPRLFRARGVLDDVNLEAAIRPRISEPDATEGGTARPNLAAAYPGVNEFEVQVPGGPSTRRENIRCPDLGTGQGGGT
ncbi:MAG: hypothetical protein OXH15_15500 [Gammaproteobacteria bacterium]|nr:hypothetical protein [Gammaproteobacteria bacterium]